MEKHSPNCTHILLDDCRPTFSWAPKSLESNEHGQSTWRWWCHHRNATVGPRTTQSHLVTVVQELWDNTLTVPLDAIVNDWPREWLQAKLSCPIWFENDGHGWLCAWCFHHVFWVSPFLHYTFGGWPSMLAGSFCAPALQIRAGTGRSRCRQGELRARWKLPNPEASSIEKIKQDSEPGLWVQ